MATRDITLKLDENLTLQLQRLITDYGIDLPTFFTDVAKQTVRNQELPFQKNSEHPPLNLYECKLAFENTKYTKDGSATISKEDEWASETEWDAMYEEMKKERGL